MKIKGVDFILYNVSDYKKAVGFYRDVLELKLIDEYGGFWAEFDVGKVILAISTHGDVPRLGYKGGATVALAVADVKAAIKHLKSKKVKIVKEPEESEVCFMATITDLDGNRIILHQRKDGTFG